ncbi:MarR family winged helix-turn-helix transcriptional regulator [Aeromicrobium ginsengisoli]|uniref:MarR family transcriptional regulator n=1 Tax=Aeromicrobium ginsengisoli TaxID=363867 RepID=A0A5M4FF83_9ACTN|nr:MarR family transcriptional regulator [Aeromicrobium ginsengisoli]KAA1398017.1 MarR family transcriptional regulator [Aeromicrobium ginsengisoli]
MADVLRLLTRAQKLVSTASDDAMRPHGVRIGQNLILEVLWDEDELTPGELARRLHLAPPTIVKTTTRMEAAGLLERIPDPLDGRLVRLRLTAHGRACQTPIQEARRLLAERATADLTAEERAVLEVALQKIIDAMSEQQ